MLFALSIIPAAITGYLLGSFPTGVIAAKLFGWPDPRKHGSGHTGGLNAYRGGGILALILVALVDLLKGTGAVVLAGHLSSNPWAVAVAGIAVVAGHNWPVWLNFSGGMGLATAAGAALPFVPMVIVIAGLIWLIFKVIIKHSPRSTIFACLTVPVTLLVLRVGLHEFIFISGMVALIAIRTLPDWNRAYTRHPATLLEESTPY